MNAGAPSNTAQSAQDHKDLSNILVQQAKIYNSLFRKLAKQDALNSEIATLGSRLKALDERGSPILDRIKQGGGFSPGTISLNPEVLEKLRGHDNDPHYSTLANKNSLIFQAKDLADRQETASETSAPSLPPKPTSACPVTRTHEQSRSSRAHPSTIVRRTPAEGYEGDPQHLVRPRRDSRAVRFPQIGHEEDEEVERDYPPKSLAFRTSPDPPSTSRAHVTSYSVGRHEDPSSTRFLSSSTPRSPTTPRSVFEHSPRNSESKAATPIGGAIRRRTQSLRGIVSFFSPAGRASASQPEDVPNQASSVLHRNKASKKI